ncbi:hypothetical protein M8J76_014917 [Diaphorina citri]|nr:hypothetical protein M8J76_014917 [Diaphorina citri]
MIKTSRILTSLTQDVSVTSEYSQNHSTRNIFRTYEDQNRVVVLETSEIKNHLGLPNHTGAYTKLGRETKKKSKKKKKRIKKEKKKKRKKKKQQQKKKMMTTEQ